MWYRTSAVNTSERALPWHTVKGVEYVCTTFINVSWTVEESSERLNKAPASCELFTCSCVKRKMARTQCPFMLCSTTNSVPTFSQPYLRDEETQTEKCPTSCHFWSPDVVFFSFSLSKMWERWGEKKNKNQDLSDRFLYFAHCWSTGCPGSAAVHGSRCPAVLPPALLGWWGSLEQDSVFLTAKSHKKLQIWGVVWLVLGLRLEVCGLMLFVLFVLSFGFQILTQLRQASCGVNKFL